MKRRKKPSENLSESTGKIGQAIDPNKPAPLMPSYDSNQPQPPSPAAHTASEPEQSASPPAQRTASPRRHQPPRHQSPRHRQAPRHAVPEMPANSETEHEDNFDIDAGELDASAAPHHDADAHNAALAKREPRGVVVLTIGLPGSGKTTWYKRRGVIPLSSDTLRQLLFDNETEQRYQGLVFSTLRSLLRARLIAKRPMNYVDATNLSSHERRQWIKMARGFGYEVHAVFFDVPLELCLERNRKRDRQVSEDVMRQMATRLKPPSFKEGFSKIVVVRVKKNDAE